MPLTGAGEGLGHEDLEASRCAPTERLEPLAYDHGLFLPRGAVAALREEVARADVVHLHGYWHLLGNAVVAAMEGQRRPLVMTPNGTLPILEESNASRDSGTSCSDARSDAQSIAGWRYPEPAQPVRALGSPRGVSSTTAWTSVSSSAS